MIDGAPGDGSDRRQSTVPSASATRTTSPAVFDATALPPNARATVFVASAAPSATSASSEASAPSRPDARKLTAFVAATSAAGSSDAGVLHSTLASAGPDGA